MTGLTATTYTHTSWLQRGTYRFWVRAVSTTGTVSNWSFAIDFRIADASGDASDLLTLDRFFEASLELSLLPSSTMPKNEAESALVPGSHEVLAGDIGLPADGSQRRGFDCLMIRYRQGRDCSVTVFAPQGDVLMLASD